MYLLFLPVSSVRDFLVEDVPAVPVKRKRTLSRNKTFLNRLLKHALLWQSGGSKISSSQREKFWTYVLEVRACRWRTHWLVQAFLASFLPLASFSHFLDMLWQPILGSAPRQSLLIVPVSPDIAPFSSADPETRLSNVCFLDYFSNSHEYIFTF